MESYMAQNNQNITICRFEVAGWPTNHKIYLEFKKKNDLFGYITRRKEKFNIF